MDVVIEVNQPTLQRVTRDRIVMRPFGFGRVTKALTRAGLELVEARPLNGTTLGSHTARISYLATSASGRVVK